MDSNATADPIATPFPVNGGMPVDVTNRPPESPPPPLKLAGLTGLGDNRPAIPANRRETERTGPHPIESAFGWPGNQEGGVPGAGGSRPLILFTAPRHSLGIFGILSLHFFTQFVYT